MDFLIVLGIISFGIMAGIYFAFSSFVMRSFGLLTKASAMSAMQSVNKVILKSPFMILFFGTTLLSLFFIAYGFLNLGNVYHLTIMGAGFVYFLGMFLCTIFFNVPLNNKLESADCKTLEGLNFWDHYLEVWTRWNHLRTIACLLSCVMIACSYFLNI